METFVWPIRVYYEDTDSGGVVYYANYLKFMERARTEWLRARGFEQDALLCDRRVLFAVRRLEVDYHRPARFNDRLEVVSQIANAGRASLTFAQNIQRVGSMEVLCGARVKVACINAESFQACRMPRDLLREIVGDA
ncbi:MAG: 4-hydroxybenzoyl-CoA thioesterase [Proteobacteria bacterium]|jgi:acyl-CoA thioester hydrolase|nr:4-hydroxybenzoyl-CoA thioesterase [Pseudomonadota bacterium]MBS1224892.1 4-hydroxybenzoyl-CoA thioesterase [Pseudomonadota bacterium]